MLTKTTDMNGTRVTCSKCGASSTGAAALTFHRCARCDGRGIERMRIVVIVERVVGDDSGEWAMQQAKATEPTAGEFVKGVLPIDMLADAEHTDVDWNEVERPIEELAQAIVDQRDEIAEEDAQPESCEYCHTDIVNGRCYCDEADRKVDEQRGN